MLQEVIRSHVFTPKECTYKIEPASRGLKFVPAGEFAKETPDNVSVDVARVPVGDGGNTIPVVVVKYDGSKRVMLYSHGNSEDLGSVYPLLVHLACHLKVTVCSYDYRGYGETYGMFDPGESECYEDARAAHGYLLGQGYNAANIIHYGRSLGSAIAIQVIGETGGAGLILDSPFLSVLDASSFWWLSCLTNMFVSREKVHDVMKWEGMRVAIIHGSADTVVPADNAESMATRMRDRLAADEQHRVVLKLFHGAGHNTLWNEEYANAYMTVLAEFLNQMMPLKA